MDAAATVRSSQPPSLGFAESDKATQDGELYHKRHNSTASLPAVTTPHLAAASPTQHSYPPGPPPPYSHHATPFTSHAPTSHPAVRTSSPPTSSLPASDSRRTSSDEKELAAMTQSSTRQSLPSISEALGVDNQASFPQTLQNAASVPPSILPLQPPHKILAEVASAAAPIMRPYPSESKAAAPAPIPASILTTPGSEIARVLYPDNRPALHVQTAQDKSPYNTATQAGSYNHANSSTSPVYERAPTQPASSAPTTFAYGYTPYPPRYRPSSSAPTVSNESGYSSSSKSSTWPSETSAPSRFAVQDRNYGESVKRHLDLYDLEAALNDIASTSNFLGDFSQRYGNLLHQSPRTGPGLSSLPSIIEVEDMIAKSRLQTEALIKIRETVLAQQAAHDQEAAEQREQQKSYAGDISSHDLDRDGFSSSDLKKRRGRAAPPGRCHSCNRAETPEWRRGPDGARTLCNACGLHYAKLTRKQNNVGKSAAIGSSNLRPKENLP